MTHIAVLITAHASAFVRVRVSCGVGVTLADDTVERKNKSCMQSRAPTPATTA